MKMIKKYVDMIDEELCDAQKYAEKSVEFKANDNSKWNNRFKAMAEDELSHAMNLHELAIEEIDKLNKVYQAPAEMLDKWEDAHRDYVDRAAWIKQMLTL